MEIVEAARQGKPIPVPVIDTHTHLGPMNSSGMHQGFESTAETVRLADEVGINAMLTAPMVMDQGNMEQANLETVLAMEQFPGRIYGNLMICPHDGEDAVKDMIRRYGTKPGFVGVKILTIYHGEPTRPEFAYAYDFAQEVGCPVTFHYWGDKLAKPVQTVLEKYPKLRVILAHQGGGRATAMMTTVKMMRQCDRLFVDCCGSLYNTCNIRDMVELMGEDRIVFGTDVLYLDPRFEIGKVAFSGISEQAMRKIFAENYLRLNAGCQLTRIRL